MKVLMSSYGLTAAVCFFLICVMCTIQVIAVQALEASNLIYFGLSQSVVIIVGLILSFGSAYIDKRRRSILRPKIHFKILPSALSLMASLMVTMALVAIIMR